MFLGQTWRKTNLQTKDETIQVENMEGVYKVFERPGLQDFLDFLFENFNVACGQCLQIYALFIIDSSSSRTSRPDWLRPLFISLQTIQATQDTEGAQDTKGRV